MSAANIVIIHNRCPVCQEIARVRCQTHVASLYGKDFTGAIEPKEYALGEPLVVNTKYPRGVAEWLSSIRGKRVTECCYAECERCRAALFAIIDFSELTPVASPRIGRETEWPNEFPR